VRSIWRGAISFGLVHIPVRAYTATEDRDVKFRLLHEVCGTPVRYRRYCETCGREVENAEITTAFELDRGEFVPLTEAEKESIPLPQAKVIEITDFVHLAQIDPIYYQKTYFLEPADGGLRAYALLRRAMEETGRVAVARVALRTKESLCAVRVYRQALAMETMYFPDEIRRPDVLQGIGADVGFAPAELQMASMLISNLSHEFEPAKYKNQYRQALLDLIKDKAAGRQVMRAPEPGRERVIDLVEALRRSVEMTGGAAAPGSTAPVATAHGSTAPLAAVPFADTPFGPARDHNQPHGDNRPPVQPPVGPPH
jgi:DNA end-binding protein Ku